MPGSASTLAEVPSSDARAAFSESELLGISLSECCQLSVDCRGRVIESEPRDLTDVPPDCRDAAASWATRERQP
jgi:hypothetical protein